MTRQDFIKTLTVGDRVDLQPRDTLGEEVVGEGVVVSTQDDGCLVLSIEGRSDLNFNSYGICMPWNQQLQIKTPQGEGR